MYPRNTQIKVCLLLKQHSIFHTSTTRSVNSPEDLNDGSHIYDILQEQGQGDLAVMPDGGTCQI